MNKEQILQLIEQELIQADEAQTDTEFEKHMYAIHMLTSLVSSHQSRSTIEIKSF